MTAETDLDLRRQRAVEYLLEDAGLTGDLTDAQATPLIAWATTTAAACAERVDLSAQALDDCLRALRRAMLQAAAAGPTASGAELVAHARAIFASR